MTVNKLLGDNLRRIRKARKLSQVKMAEFLELSTRYYQEVERGQRNPSLELLWKIAGKLEMRLEELVMFPIQKSLAEEGEELKATIDKAVKERNEQLIRRLKLLII